MALPQIARIGDSEERNPAIAPFWTGCKMMSAAIQLRLQKNEGPVR
jgi:hypothetical protein